MIDRTSYELDRLDDLAETLERLTTERNERIRQLAEFIGVTEIAQAARLSRTRVYQLLKEEK